MRKAIIYKVDFTYSLLLVDTQYGVWINWRSDQPNFILTRTRDFIFFLSFFPSSLDGVLHKYFHMGILQSHCSWWGWIWIDTTGKKRDTVRKYILLRTWQVLKLRTELRTEYVFKVLYNSTHAPRNTSPFSLRCPSVHQGARGWRGRSAINQVCLLCIIACIRRIPCIHTGMDGIG